MKLDQDYMMTEKTHKPHHIQSFFFFHSKLAISQLAVFSSLCYLFFSL